MSMSMATALFVLSALVLAVGSAQEDESITWRTDLDAARAEALESGRPLLVVFR